MWSARDRKSCAQTTCAAMASRPIAAYPCGLASPTPYETRHPTHPNTNRLLVEQLCRRSPSSRLFAPVEGQHVKAAITAMAQRHLRGVSQHRSNSGTSKGKVHANTRAFVSVGAQHEQMISRDDANAVQAG